MRLENLAKYYKDLIFSLSTSTGKHFIDIKSIFHYGLIADLSLFIKDIQEIIDSEKISFQLEPASAEAVNRQIEKSDAYEDIEERGENAEEVGFNIEEQERIDASAKIIAIYRKQEFDPFNREVIVGFPLITGTINRRKICAPLLYYKVSIDFEPLKRHVTLFKEYEVPALNFQLIKYIVESDEDVEMIRRQILPCFSRDEFDLSTVKEIITKLSELIPTFRGINLPENLSSLNEAMILREQNIIQVVNTSLLVNAKRTNAYLLDDLSQLTKIEQIDEETVVDTILSNPEEQEDEENFDSKIISEKDDFIPLFPLLSNKAQRDAAIKTNKSRLIVIQGPPGTGKSQTIVNLTCHLVSHGKSVLITSHQNKALEVITKLMPKIEYLAMSMLKNERESINELRNKIESFYAYVSNVDINEESETLERKKDKLIEINKEIRKLEVRFSELKIMEKDRFPDYKRYNEIREYDIIKANDSLPEGMDQIVANALSEYSNLLKKLGKNYIEIKSILSKNHSRIRDLINLTEHIIKIYDLTRENIFIDEEVFQLCKEILSRNSDNLRTINYLNHFIQWLDNYGYEFISSLNDLSEYHNLMLDFQKIKTQAQVLGVSINKILQCSQEILSCLEALELINFETTYPEPSDRAFIENISWIIEALDNSLNSWLKWHLLPKSRKARSFLLSLNFPEITYSRRKECVENLKCWYNHWKKRFLIVDNFKILIEEVGLPINNLTLNSSLADMHKNSHLADKYARVLSIIANFLTERLDRIDELLESHITTISSLQDLTKFKKSLTKIKIYLESLNSLNTIKSQMQFKIFKSNQLAKLERAVYELSFDEESEKIANKIKELTKYFDDYIRINSLEKNELKTLSSTCAKIKDKIIANENIEVLERPELIVEAFRLSSFIRKDLTDNPDDIQKVTEEIRKLKKESRKLILEIINRSRKIALKKAQSDNSTRFTINKLRELLKRKKKTHSFIQLRKQIDYKKILSVFPCWIMSIDDVARIFPLKAGLFDYLIVDEASQCNQATALHLAYRAKRMIVVGDEKQMKNPNTQFLSDTVVRLNLSKHGLDRHPKAEFFHGRKSLLDLAIGCQDTIPVFLNEHFRCDPPIIEFSNRHFYDGRLKILTPFRRKRFNPCMEIRLIKGAYDDPDNTKKNIIEAKAVIGELKRMIDSGQLEGYKEGEKLSVGVLSFFRQQASLLQALMYEAFEENPSIIKEHQIIVSTVDGFQGDERDVILYSFRYAPNSRPGTINAIQRVNDEHDMGRLNVAFSRARRKVLCFISTPIQNFPRGLIRDYLDYVMTIQNSVYTRLGNPNEREKCQSDFERAVFDELVKRGLEVYTQVPCAGFFIDLVVVDSEGRRMAIECDGEFHYEEGDLKEEDYQRQDIIERNGWFVHRISSRSFYANPQKAIQRLLEDLRRQPKDEEI